MAAEHDPTEPIRRGRGLRLSTEDGEPSGPNEGSTNEQEQTPVQRRRGLRLSTQAAAPPVEEVPIAGAATSTSTAADDRQVVQTACGPISYTRRGAGDPLLLLHGFGASGRIWADTMGALADLRTCYALDLPGFGGSPPLGAAPTLETLARAVVAFADALGLARFDLAGHSLGSATAAVVAGQHPARVGRLVALSLGARVFAPELAALSLGRGPLDLSLGLARPLLDLWQPVSRAVMQSPPMALTIGAQVLHRPPASAELWQGYLADHAAADPRAVLTSLAAPGDPSLLAALRAIVAPTLCIAGREDRVARLAETTTAHGLVAGSQLLVLDGCGHMVMLEQPAELHAAVRVFLSA